MTTVLYSATMSLDGFIAGPGGDMSWLTEHIGGPNPIADDLVGKIGALLIGANTFRGDDPNRGTEKEGALSGRWSGPQVVVTHRPPARPVPGIMFVDDLARGVAAAKAAAGDGYVAVLGADVAAQCLEAGLLDEILVFVAPVLLGDGVPLFRRPGGTRIPLDQVTVGQAPVPTSWVRIRR